eukprot:CAMPEP_0194226672 /NCGR_PEP_ID=MMETSP0156-20130528/42319_1 /TAXON_ID=33649 /ORGANISM="Thalassionema nitzschioides, Strain L26-B" /LENGTH=268 /DNA_ID=CAMNT_0038959107 /DNA_START=272 /DNA_END=1078 /DNA_ORIENTATION=+
MLASGTIARTLQYGLERIFEKNPVTTNQNTTTTTQQLLQKSSAQTAHSIVAVLLMILVSSVGIGGLLLTATTSASTTAFDRLFMPNSISRWLSAIISGAFVVWDIPTSIRLKKKPDVIVHHVVMAVLTILGATALPTWYCLYYFGVAELSSILLILYDQIHSWRELSYDEQPSSLWMTSATWESTTQAVAAVAFTLVRAISFPYVTIRYFVPDCWILWKGAASTRVTKKNWILLFIMTLSIGFTLLQLYWFSLMVKTIIFRDKEGDPE